MKVFYSWQLDSPRKVNKDLIHDALQLAIAELQAEILLAEAERDLPEIELDQDTKGIMGSPPISQVILEKIEGADVIVADVTLVAKGAREKLHINSNVAIELGYALGKHSYEPILKVMNTDYGGFEQLPFDLRDRRRPCLYSLSESADKAEIQAEKNALRGNLSRFSETI